MSTFNHNDKFFITSGGNATFAGTVTVDGGQILTPSGVNLALNPNTGLVTVGGVIQCTGTGTSTFAGNVTVTGDFQVNGTTTTVNATNLDLSDNIIGLNRGASSNSNDSGLIIERGSTGDNAAMIWDEANDRFLFGLTTSTPAATGSISISSTSNLAARDLDVNNITSARIVATASGTDIHQLVNASTNGTVLQLITTGDDPDKTLYFQSDHIYTPDTALHIQNNNQKLFLKGSQTTVGTTTTQNGYELTVSNGPGSSIYAAGDSNFVGATYTDGIVRSRKNIVSNSTYNVMSLNSSRTIDDYGGLNKDYMKIDLVTPGPNTDGGSSAHGFGAFSLKLANNGANTNMTEVLNISAGANATFAGQVIASSSSSGDYVRMYGGSGTAQWDIYGNGENLRFSENSGGGGHVDIDTNLIVDGNVGINITVPTAKIDVREDANNVYTGYFYNSNTGSTAHGINVQTASTNADAYAFRVNSASNSNALVVKGNANVGIGTDDPGAPLQVNAAIYSQIRLHSDHTYSVNRNWRFITNNFGNGNWGGFSIESSSSQGGTSYTPKFGIDVSGNVGIGINTSNTAVSAKLHVAGNSILANNTTIDPDSVANTVVAGAVADGSGWGLTAAIGGNAGTGHSWGLGSNGSAFYMGYQNGSAVNTLQSFLIAYTNRHLQLVPTSGNVVIGNITATPDRKLHVTGDDSDGIKISGGTNGRFVELSSSNLNYYTTSSGGYAMGQRILKNSDSSVLGAVSGAYGTGSALTYMYYGGTAYNDAAMYILPNKNIGIGTTSPDTLLHVVKDSSNSQLTLQRTGTATGKYEIYTNTNSLFIYDRGQTALRAMIDSSGNFGIGFDSPAAKIHIGSTGTNAYSSTITKGSNMKGIINTVSNNADDMVGIYFATGTTTEGTHWSGITGSRSDNTSHWGTQLNFYTHANDTANLNDATQKMVIKGDGKVGIGNNSPDATLELGTPSGTAGSAGSVNRFFISPYSNTGGPYKFIARTVSGSSDFLDMYYGSNHIISYGLDGKIGIGTTSPDEKLSVDGNIFLQGNDDYIAFNTSASSGHPKIKMNTDASFTFLNTAGSTSLTLDNGGAATFAGNVTANSLTSHNTRISTAEEFPVGHYTGGKEIWSIDPTWSESQLQDYFGNSNVSWNADSTAPAGYAIYINGSVNVGGQYDSGFPYIPVETDAIYYMECYIRNAGTGQTHYMGSIDYNESFGSLGGNPGSYGYWVMSNTNPGASWTKVHGIIRGNDANSVGYFENGTKYWTPQALFNYGAGSGTRACYISGWKVVKISSAEYYADGSASEPSISFAEDKNTGIYRSASDTINFSTAGTNALTIGNNNATFAGEIHLTDSNTKILEGSGNAVKIQTNSGSITIGPQNTSYAHMQTDLSRFYFSKKLVVNEGIISSYDEDLRLRRTESNNDSILITDTDISFILDGAEDMRLQNDGDLHVEGDVIAYSTTVSDNRLKDNVLTLENSLDKVSKLRGVEYTWNATSRKGQKDIGVIAQEVEEVIPEIVREKKMSLVDGEKYKTVDYEKLTAVLIEAVKELKEEVEELKNKCNDCTC